MVKAQVFLTDLDNFHGFDTVWKRYFKQPPPRTTIGCTGLLVPDTLVEIDLIGTSAIAELVVRMNVPSLGARTAAYPVVVRVAAFGARLLTLPVYVPR